MLKLQLIHSHDIHAQVINLRKHDILSDKEVLAPTEKLR